MITPAASEIGNNQLDSTVDTQGSPSMELDPQSRSVTEPFVGRWNTLISQTNWEKGKIISEWRSALIASGAAPSAFSDDVWSKQVGAVTSQHVGRLRRVFERFGSTQTSFPGLYWSHFLACIDWDDAELWLEGAMRSKWSISEMRRMRWESNGGDPKHAPRDEELITSEVDDDYQPMTAEAEVEQDRELEDRIEASGPYPEDPDFGDESENSDRRDDDETEYEDYDFSDKDELTNPFASLPQLPPDVAEAMEQFKLAIVRHRSGHWSDIAQAQMLEVLDALKAFASR